MDKGHVEATPFRKGGLPIRDLFTEELGRERRLEPGEKERILAAANQHLQDLATAALETACRKGELLMLQWRQVRFDLNEIHLPAKTTKARRPRYLPMSQRLRALLEMRRQDPEGQAYGQDKFVFGDVTGARIKSVKVAWANAVLKANGIKPTRTKNGNLTPECQQHLDTINLNFHDLRRESGSSLLEGRMPLNAVQMFLDHANVSTTSRYLKVNRHTLHAALKRFEEERDSRCNLVVSNDSAPEPMPANESSKSVQ